MDVVRVLIDETKAALDFALEIHNTSLCDASEDLLDIALEEYNLLLDDLRPVGGFRLPRQQVLLGSDDDGWCVADLVLPLPDVTCEIFKMEEYR